MATPSRHDRLTRSERDRPSGGKRTGPALTPEDLVPHLLGLARTLREGDGHTPPEPIPHQRTA
ncbi:MULTISPECIES: hypothetical protein [unclassified Nocardiopsis]|uniref:hypothetical protein n=1 Tax=unclassified Nocardiopsis TaxID=2649073 RepID=UPI00066E4057|nr:MULTISPECIES: hypothetical protein [unclassified Nocardiopsis]MBQ1081331.1 hypothetical protein [Nocardiopsis sp. B62]